MTSKSHSTFTVDARRDAGEFTGARPRLKFDILREVGKHSQPDTVDLQSCKHLKPYAIACLCAMAELARRNGRRMLATPPTDRACADHLSRMGLPEFFESDWPSSVQRDTNLVVRLVDWSSSLEAESERIIDMLAPRTELAPGVFPQLVSSLEEVINNALTHADSPIDCIVAGQAFPQTGKIDVAVVDLGQTIRGHLSKNPRYSGITTDADSLRRALEHGVTGTPDHQLNSRGGQNSGAGLAELNDYCVAGGGVLTVLSGDSMISSGPDQPAVIGPSMPHFRGCLVNIRFFAENALPHRKVSPIF